MIMSHDIVVDFAFLSIVVDAISLDTIFLPLSFDNLSFWCFQCQQYQQKHSWCVCDNE